MHLSLYIHGVTEIESHIWKKKKKETKSHNIYGGIGVVYFLSLEDAKTDVESECV